MSLRQVLLPFLLVGPAAGGPSVIDYAGQAIEVDGRLDEWSDLPIVVQEPTLPPPHANLLRAAFGWQSSQLCLAFAMQDADLQPPPTRLSSYQFHLTDSLQWYLDSSGNSNRRMDDDDFNILLLPDGRAAVLRGDSLLAELTGSTVPQRAAHSVALQYASQPSEGGWTGEVCLPAATLGRGELQAGQAMKMDLAINDWQRILEPLPELDETQVLQRLLRPQVPQSPVAAELQPWSWAGKRDFGYPQYWRRLQFDGGPGWWQRRWLQLGQGAVWSLIIGIAGLISAGLLAWQAQHYRSALRQLLQRLAELQSTATTISPNPLPPDSASEPIEPIQPIDPRVRQFCDSVLAFVQSQLDRPLTPETLAAQFNVSLRTLQRRLREGLDTRPQELILAVRLAAADRLLAAGVLRVAEVAQSVGFEDPAYFSRRYRENFGCTPSERRGRSGLDTV